MSSPDPPNPAATAAAQTQSNVATSIAQAAQNNVNQITPYGTLTYQDTGSTTVPNGVGGTITVPTRTATTTLSPEEQKLFDLGEATKTNVGQIGLDASGRIGDLLSNPVDLSPTAVGGYLTDLGNARLQPILQQQWQQREADLMNRGIMPGSDQYKLEQDAFNRQRDDAYNQLILSGYGQGVQSILAQRNQPINEITALLSGSQVSQPNFVNTPQTTVQPTNVAGIYNDAYTAQAAQNNAMLGGLFGLGSAGIMATNPLSGLGGLFGLKR